MASSPLLLKLGLPLSDLRFKPFCAHLFLDISKRPKPEVFRARVSMKISKIPVLVKNCSRSSRMLGTYSGKRLVQRPIRETVASLCGQGSPCCHSSSQRVTAILPHLSHGQNQPRCPALSFVSKTFAPPGYLKQRVDSLQRDESITQIHPPKSASFPTAGIWCTIPKNVVWFQVLCFVLPTPVYEPELSPEEQTL